MDGATKVWVLPYRAASGAFGTIQSALLDDDPGIVRIEISDPDLPFVVTGDVQHSRVQRLEYRATAGEWVTHRMLRSPNVVSFLERWAALARESLGSWRAREDGSVVAYPVPPSWDLDREEMLKSLEQAVAARRAEPRPTRLRGLEADQLLLKVVRAYNAACESNDPEPRTTVGNRLGYSPSHIGRLLVKARRPDPKTGRPVLLGAALPGRAGQHGPIDEQAVARWAAQIGAEEES